MGTPLPEGGELMFMELLHATMRTQAASTSAKEIQRDITTPPVTVFEMRLAWGQQDRAWAYAFTIRSTGFGLPRKNEPESWSKSVAAWGGGEKKLQ
jgi:hypothetical protein